MAQSAEKPVMNDVPSFPGLGDTGDQYSILYKDVERTVCGVIAATELDENRQNKIREYFMEQQKASESQPLTVNQWFTQIASHAARPDYDEEIYLLLYLIIGISYMRERGRNFNEPEDELSLNLIWSHIKAALVHTRVSFKPSQSSVGFVSVPLCSLVENGTINELWRLHVWLPDGKRGNPDLRIHRHHAFGQSWILAGNGMDQRWKVKAEANAEVATHAEYCVSWNDGNGSSLRYKTYQVSSTVTNTRKYVVARPQGPEQVLRRGMTYCIPPNEWHSSHVEDHNFFATLFVFDAHRGTDKDAPILGPKNSESFESFKSPPDISIESLIKRVEAVRGQEDSRIVAAE